MSNSYFSFVWLLARSSKKLKTSKNRLLPIQFNLSLIYYKCIKAKHEGGFKNMGDQGFNYGAGFALIVVLFILLIIVGAAWL